ncbi:hypothetical protein Tco_0842953 [Tanacetum coccineum]|uniref:Xylulose kinase-1 n=1 Tax=Tanacetum coccineum TaxID=301880 RepID=A0ABQ5B4T7_9ASTR
MSSPKFAEKHNVVVFLEKPDESDGFAEIIDFLKASYVLYALTVNPVIYISCIEQFWATAKVQTVNEVRQLQALVDKKKVTVTESSIRRDLHLDDAEGTDCLPTATIFEELARMGEAEVPQDEAEHEESVPTPSNDPQPTKDTQAKEIAALKKRIQRLERRKMSRPTGLKRLSKVGISRRVEFTEDQESLGAPEDASKQGRSIEDIDADVTLVDETQERHDDDLMFNTGVLEDDEMPVEAKVDGKGKHSTKPGDSTAGEAVTTASVEGSAIPTTIEEITLDRGVVIKEEGREETAKDSRKKMLERKRAGKEQQQESSKKQKVEKEKESDKVDEAELKKLLVIKKDEDIAINAIPLATKLPVIIDYKLHKEGMMVHYQLIRADGSSKRYSSMIRMLQGIDREDLEALWRIVKAKYGDTRPENEFERVLWGDLKVMFEPDIKSDIWRMLQGYRVTVWKLIDSSGVHFVRRNLKIQKMNIKFRGGLLGLKRLHGFLEVTTAQGCWWKALQCVMSFYCQEDIDELKEINSLEK